MIPEDQLVAVGGEVLFTVLDKGRKCRGVCHGTDSGIVHKLQQASLLDLIDLVFAAADNRIVPTAAASGIDDHVDIIGNLCGSHLLQVRGRHLAAGLKVRAAKIDHDGHYILAVSEDLCTFFPGPGRNFIAQVPDSAAVRPGASLRAR